MIVKVFLVLFFFLNVFSLFCDKQPQRSGWISFEAFSNMDHIADVFEAINEKITKRNESVNVDGKIYSFTDFELGAWYNTANQQQSFVNDTVSKVQCGKLTISYDFKYSIEGGKNGTASGHVVASPFSFRKSLFMNGGALAWDLVSSDTILVESQKLILRSEPLLSDSDKKVFEDLLNYHSQNKSTIFNVSVQDLNQRYKSDLKQFLQQQHIVVVNNQQYSYGDVNVTYISVVKEQKLTNIGFKGLQFSCFFELQNYTNKCVDLPTQHMQDYGGLQQIIAFPWLQANLMYLAKNKYFDMKLNQHTWQSNYFQFYIGDIANVIQQASKEVPSTPITIQCTWDSERQNQTFVQYFSLTSIYIQVPLTCVIKAKDTTIQTVKFVMVNVLDVKLGTSNLFVKVKKVEIIKVKYQSAGSYVVTKPQLANQVILSVANNLVGKSVFGNGFKTTQRNAPSLTFRRDYLVMFDASEI